MPVPSRAAMIAPATSPSVIRWIRAPVSRTCAISSSCRGRSRMTTVTSCGAHALGLGHGRDVGRRRRVDVHHVGRGRAGGQLGHVEHRGRVVHRAAVGHRQDRDRVRHPVGAQPGAVDRVDGDVAGRAGAVADLLAVEQHRRVVLLALADDHHAAHRHRVDQHPHRVHRGPVGPVLVTAAHPPGGGHRRGLGHPGQLEGQVAVGGMGGWRVGLLLRGHGRCPSDGRLLILCSYPGALLVHPGGRATLSCGEPGAAVNRVVGGGLSALGCLLAAAVLVVAIPAPHAAEPVTVSYRADLARLTRLAPYPAVAPRGLPASWQPVSSGLAVGGANGAGTVTWAARLHDPGRPAGLARGDQRGPRGVRPADDQQRRPRCRRPR